MEFDQDLGVVKTNWTEIRTQVEKVTPVFAKLIDEVSPDNSFCLFLAFYPYGALKGDTVSTFIPFPNNTYMRLTDNDLPKDIAENLGYGRNSAPLAILLDNCMELFIDLWQSNLAIPKTIYKPGAFLSISHILNRSAKRSYATNRILAISSGVRSTFMLPNIGCSINHSNLKSDFNIQSNAPKSLYDHWDIFKEIANSKIANCKWRSCLAYFSETWISHILNDPAWLKIKLFFYDLAWKQFEYRRNTIYYDLFFSITQKRRNLKPNPYLTDTAKHLFAIALGEAPGFSPSKNDYSLPASLIQNAFISSYGLKKYYPTILETTHFESEASDLPIYYSLQNPSMLSFSPRSRRTLNTLLDIRELEYIMKTFTNELLLPNSPCADTDLLSVAKNITYKYFHNKHDKQNIIHSTETIPDGDSRFITTPSQTFASDAPFVRGCIGLSSTPPQTVK